MTVTATYLDDLGRVRIVFDTEDATVDHATVERSLNGVRWHPVRGAGTSPITAGAGRADDYEYAPGMANTYRVSYVDTDTGVVATETTTITPEYTGVWIKNVRRPNFNRKVQVIGLDDIERPSRSGVFDVIGRPDPIAVTEVQGSRRTTLTVRTTSLADAASLDHVLSTGDVLLFHGDGPDCPVPTLYAVVGDITQSRPVQNPASTVRYTEIPVTEVAAPDVSVFVGTVVWQDIDGLYATWTDLVAAEPTWSDVLNIVTDTEVITP